MRRSILVLALVACASGCHTFQPASIAELAPGEAVRARISGAFADSLSTILPGDTRVVEGTYVEANGPTVYLDVPVTSSYQGMRLQTLNQRVEIPESAFTDLERKSLSKSRTGLALGAVVAASAAIIIAQLSGDTGGAALPGGGGPVDAVVATPSVSLIRALSWVWSR